MLDSPVENDPTHMGEKTENTNVAETKKNKRKRPDIQNANGEKDETAPTKTLRSERQKAARSAPSTLALKSQLENIIPPNDLNLRDSPQPPPSPSPVINKDSPLLLTDRTPRQTSTPSTPSDIFCASILTATTPEDYDDSSTETGEAPTTQISIKDRMAAAEERGDTKVTSKTNLRNPLDKYTDHEMKEVHYNHSMAALKNIDFETLENWENIPNGKLLAQPFGEYTNKLENQSTLKTLIFAAAAEITDTTSISVSAPRRKPTADRNPTTFLIHGLTEKQKQTLLNRRGVWSSENITFRVMHLEPACPDFLFLIKGLTTEKETIYNAIREVWNDAATEEFFGRICNQVPEKDQPQAALALNNFRNALKVELLETKSKGGLFMPTFQVYTSGAAINDDRTWCQLRAYLASREYHSSPIEEPGNNLIPAIECGICHGFDHMRGLCPFPMIPGWNGPRGKTDPPLANLSGGRGASQQIPNRDRNKTRMG